MVDQMVQRRLDVAVEIRCPATRCFA